MNDSQNNILNTPGGLINQNVQQSMFSNPQLNALLGKVQSGQMSIQDAISQSGQGGQTPEQVKAWQSANYGNNMNKYGGNGAAMADASNAGYAQENDPGFRQTEFMRQLAANPTTGGMLASYNVSKDPLMQGGLDAEKQQLQTGQGLFNDQSGRLTQMQNQGFQLKPEDQTLYGQTSGNIARMFGQQGNAAASNLAMRGMSNSGAAGATFSGLQGNQNEMLAQAQQQIMQQRFQNTQNQIAQQQQFMGNLNSQNNQMAGKFADTSGQYQNQAFNQNMESMGNQQGQANNEIKNSADWQSLNQNEGNEQFAQKQATSAGSAIGQAAGLAGGLAKAGASMFGGPAVAGAGAGSTMGAGGATQLPGTNPNNPAYYGPVR